MSLARRWLLGVEGASVTGGEQARLNPSVKRREVWEAMSWKAVNLWMGSREVASLSRNGRKNGTSLPRATHSWTHFPSVSPSPFLTPWSLSPSRLLTRQWRIVSTCSSVNASRGQYAGGSCGEQGDTIMNGCRRSSSNASDFDAPGYPPAPWAISTSPWSV